MVDKWIELAPEDVVWDNIDVNSFILDHNHLFSSNRLSGWRNRNSWSMDPLMACNYRAYHPLVVPRCLHRYAQ